MKNKFVLFIISALLTASLAACASGDRVFEPLESPRTENMERGRYDDAVQEEQEFYAFADTAYDSGENAGGGTVSTPIKASSRMVIRTVNLTMQTMEFDAGVETIEEIVAEYGGFMQDLYVQGKDMFDRYGTRRASFTVRIPSEKLDAFVNNMGGKFNITDKRTEGNDITDTYFDTDARLKSLRIREERLLAMLEQAEELEYLLQVERELAHVRYEIESLTSSLLRMRDQVSMSTVYINLSEVVEYTPVEPQPVTFGEKLGRTFKGSLDSFIAFVQGAVLAFVWLLPFLVLIGAFTALIILLSVSAKRKRKRKRLDAHKNNLPPQMAKEEKDENP